MDTTKPMCTLSTIATNCHIGDLLGYTLGLAIIVVIIVFAIVGVYLMIKDSKGSK